MGLLVVGTLRSPLPLWERGRGRGVKRLSPPLSRPFGAPSPARGEGKKRMRLSRKRANETKRMVLIPESGVWGCLWWARFALPTLRELEE